MDGFARPKRFTKYNVTFEHWESGHYFPKFCSGPATGETIQTVVKIYEKAKETLNLDLKLEDVLFTGVLRETAGVPPPIDYSKVSLVCKNLAMQDLTIIFFLATRSYTRTVSIWLCKQYPQTGV